jgi:hypothetical protein
MRMYFGCQSRMSGCGGGGGVVVMKWFVSSVQLVCKIKNRIAGDGEASEVLL